MRPLRQGRSREVTRADVMQADAFGVHLLHPHTRQCSGDLRSTRQNLNHVRVFCRFCNGATLGNMVSPLVYEDLGEIKVICVHRYEANYR